MSNDKIWEELITIHSNFKIIGTEEEKDEKIRFPWERPGGGFFAHLWWLLFFPMELMFFLTIPDVRRYIKF